MNRDARMLLQDLKKCLKQPSPRLMNMKQTQVDHTILKIQLLASSFLVFLIALKKPLRRQKPCFQLCFHFERDSVRCSQGHAGLWLTPHLPYSSLQSWAFRLHFGELSFSIKILPRPAVNIISKTSLACTFVVFPSSIWLDLARGPG